MPNINYYWAGADNAKWNQPGNWRIGSSTGISDGVSYPGHPTSSNPGYYSNAWIQKDSKILVGSSAMKYVLHLNIGAVNSSTRINVQLLADPASTPTHFDVYGNCNIINCNFDATDLNKQQYLALIGGSTYVTGSTTILNGNLSTINTHVYFYTSVAGWNFKLAGNFELYWNRFIRFMSSGINIYLNGYGLTMGDVSSNAGTNVVNFIFTPHEDNTETTNNLSYMYFPSPYVINTTYITSSQVFGFTSGYKFTAIGQRVILVYGCDPEAKTIPLTNAQKKVRYFDSIIVGNLNDISQWRSLTTSTVDTYVIDDHPEQSGLGLDRDTAIYGTLDFTGNTPGTNVPKGPGSTSTLFLTANNNSEQYYITGHFLLNKQQKVTLVSADATTGTSLTALAIGWMPKLVFVHDSRLRRNTVDGWNDENPVLAQGEIGWEFNPGNTSLPDQIKIGNGTSTWKQLKYARRDTAKKLKNTNPSIVSGETVWESDTNYIKINTSTTPKLYNSLTTATYTTPNNVLDYSGHPSYSVGLGDGWVIDTNHNNFHPKTLTTLAVTESEGNLLAFILGINARVYLISSSFAAKNIYIASKTSNHSGILFICGDSKLIYAMRIVHLGGAISTVYGDGTTPKILSLQEDYNRGTTTWTNYNNSAVYDYYFNETLANFNDLFGYMFLSGVIELYSPNDILITGLPGNAANTTWITSYFYVVNWEKVTLSAYYSPILPYSQTINFYFLTANNGSYSNGMIQADVFAIDTSTFSVGVYSDIGNLTVESSASFQERLGSYFSAIKTTFKGASPNSSTNPDYKATYYNKTQPTSYSAHPWAEYQSYQIISTASITLKSYQFTQDSLPYYYLNSNFMEPGGPLIALISRNNTYKYGSSYFNGETERIIVSHGGQTHFIIDENDALNKIAFYTDPTNSAKFAKVAGLDMTQAVNDPYIYLWSLTDQYVAFGDFYVTNSQGGNIYGGPDTSYFWATYNIYLSGGSSRNPARVDIPNLQSADNSFYGPKISLTITDGYYTISGSTVSPGSLTLNKGTLNQTLNSDSVLSPTFNKVNLDGSSVERTFIHGFNASNGNPVAFYISGNIGTLWSSGGSGLTITTFNTGTNEQFAPSVIDFTSENLDVSDSIVIYPGSLGNFVSPLTPDQSALTFSFNKQGTSKSLYWSLKDGYGTAMCVQTIMLGYHEYTTNSSNWIGWQGNMSIQNDLIFCGSEDIYPFIDNEPPLVDTLYYYQQTMLDEGLYSVGGYVGYGNGIWNQTYQYGGLNLGPNTITATGTAELYFQGDGKVRMTNPTPSISTPPINFGSSKYKDVIQFYKISPATSSTYQNYYIGTWTVGLYPISSYVFRGFGRAVNVLGGNTVFDWHRINNSVDSNIAYFNTASVNSLFVKDTMKNQTKQNTVADLYGIDLRIGGYVDGGLTTYNNTSTQFFASLPSSLSFAGGSQFNANLGTYPDINIRTYRPSAVSPVPTITINPCSSDAAGAPLINTPSSVILGDLGSSGVGPSVFQFTPGTTSTFINFTYVDESAPFNTTASWYAYANTLSNTVLKSSVNGLPWYLSIPTPHLGTIREKHEVSNFTIRDCIATENYIWFSPGTVNVNNTGIAYREGYVNQGVTVSGAKLNYYNYDGGGNTGWVFHEPPSASMDLSFWANPPYEVLGESKDSYYYNTFYGQSWSSTNFVTPGSYTWIAPAGVYSITVTAIGGGGGGSVAGGAKANTGGGGGGLAWATNVPVVPGQSYTVVVGLGGTANNSGGDSYFQRPQSYLEVRGLGGKSGTSAAIATVTLAGGSGGTSTFQTTGTGIVTGGGFGGAGGTYTFANSGAYGFNTAGGGAGGYTGAGGRGQGNNATFDNTNQGQGGGGAGGSVSTGTTRGGGGTGLYGEGVSGLIPNGGGSGGSASNLTNGGLYGGGGAGVASGTGVSQGGNGAVRISWPGFFGPK